MSSVAVRRQLRFCSSSNPGASVHVALVDRPGAEVIFTGGRPLVDVCAERGICHAIVGGFFDSDRPAVPLGELVCAGRSISGIAVPSPWADRRACVTTAPDGALQIARRCELDVLPGGGLLQAGPLLICDGQIVDLSEDFEGFSALAEQFDSDITAVRHPRAAMGLTGDGTVVLVCVEGRQGDQAGVTLEELAQIMAEHGCEQALNLDGGASATLICDGQMVNRSMGHGHEFAGGRPVCSAIVFT